MKLTDRKDEHLSICLNEEVDLKTNSFGSIQFEHDAVPEISLDEVDIRSQLFGKSLEAPLIIGAMTGGTQAAQRINQRLALAAESCGVGFALGSQRKMLEDENLISSYNVRSTAKNLKLLFGNIGAVQLNYGVSVDQIVSLIESCGCDAFYFHLNPLQEAIQPEGQTNFKDLLSKIEYIASQVRVPVLVKEVGCGFSKTAARKLASLSISGIETAGVGGTSWSYIESLRTEDPIQRQCGETFKSWGVSTANSIINCREAFGSRTVIGSGGIRNGLDAAKALWLGADAVAFALPMLRAAEHSMEAAIEAIELFKTELRTALFLTGSKNIVELKLKSIQRNQA